MLWWWWWRERVLRELNSWDELPNLPCSAPRPSLLLVAPVVAFMLAAMFIAVYWPLSVQPDGGLAVMQGAGWVPVLVTLLYALLWLQVRKLLGQAWLAARCACAAGQGVCSFRR